MAGLRANRLRRVALTGALAPALVLGAAGFGVLPGGMLPTGVTAQSVIDGGSCTAFGTLATAQATEMSVADVAEKANPAVVTILNMQPISQADLRGIAGIEGFPDLPQIPGTDGLQAASRGPTTMRTARAKSTTLSTATHSCRLEAVPDSSSTRLATSSQTPTSSGVPRN